MSDHDKADTDLGLRFVVLKHTDDHGVHFDLMIEQGGLLATWKCLAPPEESGTAGVGCFRIADHRRDYLDYEGPISGGRGRIQRYDQGLCRVNALRPQRWEVTFRGRRLAGPYILERRQVEEARETPKRQNAKTPTRLPSPQPTALSPQHSAPLPQSWSLRAQ